MSDNEQTITLSLISHTNVGKTTLARTLLRRDVGEVLDQPHVTDVSEAYAMMETAQEDLLRLWDTPGFGDSARLLRRLKMSGNPVGWILTQVWDRFADRPLWCSQQAMRNVREEADVVLYLLNAAEDPEDAGYVDIEMEILSWMEKPILVMLNQLGPWRDASSEGREEERWRRHLEKFGRVRGVLSLDAFARCWIQEGALLDAVARVLPIEKQIPFARLSKAWREKNLKVFQESMKALAGQLARACTDRHVLEKSSWLGKLRNFFLPLHANGSDEILDKQMAMKKLAENLDKDIRETMDELIELHGLEGHAAGEILDRLKSDYETTEPVNDKLAALLGGFVSGALGGLAADLAAGGLTFGGGAIVGGFLGAAGASGLSKGYNLVRGEKKPVVRWSLEFFEGLVRSALLRYLAVAHFGRGRGDFKESEHPKSWQALVQETVAGRRQELQSIWERGKGLTASETLHSPLAALLAGCAQELLGKLYPNMAPDGLAR